jgi:ABC-type branched-subunit amino acid transport system ATPase component/uncharacterized coiled-coil DUF342 family protein
MFIESLEVEEGFLGGTSLAFTEGLNVIIGPRGAGKTSVVELIRFCFDVDPYTRQAGIDARQHALSILGSSGRATVIVNVDGERLRVSRAANEDEPRIYVEDRPIVLSQREIESIGVDASGRLRLLDAFRPIEGRADEALVSELSSLTVRLQDLATELGAVLQQIEALSDVTAELREAETQETEVGKSVAATSKERERLSAVGNELAALSVRSSVFERTLTGMARWMREIESASQSGPRLEDWPEAAHSPEPLSAVRKRVAEASASMREALVELRRAVGEVDELRKADMATEVVLSDEARELRKQVEAVQAGAGDVSRRVAQLRERVGQLSALRALETQRRAEITELQAKRTTVLDGIDAHRDSRFAARLRVAERLRRELAPRIDLKLTQGAQVAAYASAITSSLRGSGLHYKNLAPRLAERLAPRELVQAVERSDAGLIASVGQVSPERAARLVDHIKTTGSEEILAAPIDDAVDFFLLDGKDYKPTEQLSTGQRCTVVLPILLAHDEKVLVVDEPEAHLDNAFVVGTVVQALRSRNTAQTICATHNANIPVLGNADRVISLQSDGVHGFVACAASLESSDIVDAISTVMEGGREAFALRAKFYKNSP